MEGRIFSLFLKVASICCLSLAGYASVATASEETRTNEQLEPVIQPEIERREIKEAKIDKENFEISLFTGVLSIEDFGSGMVMGARFDYHITEDIFIEAAIGQSTAGKTSLEIFNDIELMTDDERRFLYYDFSIGYNLFPGEAFIGKNHAFNNALYIIGGAGNTTFAGDDHFTVNIGLGYRILFTDFLAMHFDFKDHMLNLEITGEDKLTHNLELTTSLSYFF